MNKSLSPTAIVLSIVALLAVIGLGYILLGDNSRPPSTNADDRILQALEKNGGNVEKLDPELRKLYDEGIKSGRYKSGGASTGPRPSGSNATSGGASNR